MPDVVNSFPGYEFVRGEDGKMHNMYRGVDLGFGGYVYSEPGMYGNVALLDAASMHPTSIVLLNKLGEYTKNYADLRAARVFIKHGDYESAGNLFGGKFKKYLEDENEAEALSKALKLPLNAFFGISFSSFPFRARDPRDHNNIIALRGALFMKTLQDEIARRGFKVVHIKTDSVKVANATPEIIEFVKEFGQKYGYEMEHECTYERMCLIDKANYIARYDEHGIRNKGGKHPNEWTATGKEFQVPYVFKTLFSKEPIKFEDMCEVLSVKTALYLREDENDPEFVGRVGQFCPIKPGHGGKELLRESKDADGNVKYGAATGTKGYFWLESEVARQLGKEDDIDRSYYDDMVTKAVETISQFGDFERFVDLEHPYPVESFTTPCHSEEYESCLQCPLFHTMEVGQGPDICEKGFYVDDVLPF